MASTTGPLPQDTSRSYVVTVTVIVTTSIAVILTALRIYVRAAMVKLLGWDDLLNVLAAVTMVVVLGLVMTAAKGGLGRHIVYTDKHRAVFAIKLLRIAEFHLILATVLAKAAICVFLLNLFVRNKSWKIFLWSFIAFNTITSMLDAAFIFPQCTPVELNWDKSVKGHCWSDAAINGIGIMQGSIAAATDFILSILPTVFLWNIKIIWRVKIGICAIMALGFASGGFALARTVLVPSLTATHDPTWDLVPLFMWAILESNFGIIAAAAPSLRPLIGGSRASTNKSKTPSTALSRARSGQKSQNTWLDMSSSRNGRPVQLHDEEEVSEGGDEVEMLRYNNRGILKTTEVEIKVM